jgi:hypothetical protein
VRDAAALHHNQTTGTSVTSINAEYVLHTVK